MKNKTYCTTGDAAKILHCSRDTIVKILEAGEIRFWYVSTHRRMFLADVIAYAKKIGAL